MAFNQDKVQELYPEAVMYEAMKIHASTDVQLQNACNSGEYMGQFKKDGYWYQFEKHNTYSYLFSRSPSSKTGLQTEKSANVPHIMEALSCLPKDTILVGEIYYPGKTSKACTEVMGCLPQKAIDRQNGAWGKIHYYIHDILMYDGVDFVVSQTTNELRYKILEKIYKLHNLEQYDFLELAETWYDDLYERVGTALDNGEEGMVIKKRTGVYEPGKRPDTNLKAKKVDFADVVIIGFEAPTARYYGTEINNWQYWVGTDDHEERLPVGCHNEELCVIAVTKPYYMGWNNSRINIGAYDDKGNLVNIGTIHSGISDEMKQDMTEHPERYFNKVCSIQCMEKDSVEHTIRHGFYKHMREDKSAEDCKLRDIF